MIKSGYKGIAAMLSLLLCLLTLSPVALAADEVPVGRIPVKITLEGAEPAVAEEFQVKLTAVEDTNPMPAGSAEGVYITTIAGAGSAVLEIGFDTKGIYEYTLAMVPGENPDCSYDPGVYRVTVYVTDQENDAGVLETFTVMYKDNSENKTTEAVFNNVYAGVGPEADEVTLCLITLLDGKEPEDGMFTFCLYGDDGSILQTRTNDGSNAAFDAISFDEEGTFVYRIAQLAGKDENIVYDPAVYVVTVTVTVTENGDYEATVAYSRDGSPYTGTPLFLNVTRGAAEPPVDDGNGDSDIPNTGDETDITGWVSLMAAGVIVLLALAFTGRKKENQNKG